MSLAYGLTGLTFLLVLGSSCDVQRIAASASCAGGDCERADSQTARRDGSVAADDGTGHSSDARWLDGGLSTPPRPVGQPCREDFDSAPDQATTVLVTDSPTCASGRCLWHNQRDRTDYQPLCTTHCERDEQCPTSSPWCPAKLICFPPLALGTHRCEGFCMCSADNSSDFTSFIEAVCL